MKEQQKNQKTAYLELLRIIACFFVIVNHTNSGVFLSQTPDHKVWWISLTYFFMCKTAVPVFLMITGCLMLGKIDNYRKYITRIVRMVLVIVLFSFLYYVKSMQDAGRPIEIIEYFKLIYQRHVTNAYWYLYLYLGILLMMPFFQILSTNMKRREYQILMLISVVAMGGLPVLIHYRPGFSLSYMFTEPFPSVYVGMLFVGYYLTHYVEVKKNIVTPKLTINVKVLPDGKPANFSGGVGEFTISSSISTKELKTNDAVTIKLVISGTGNLKLVNTPEVAFPKDFEVYDPKIDNKFTLTREGLSGNKVIEYLAIPRHAGNFTIPPVEFSYFDLKSNSYKTIKTEAYNLKVEKGAGNADQVIADFTNKEDLKVLGQDIRYIKMGETSLTRKGDFFFGSTTYYLWYIIPLVLFVVFVIVYRKKAIENANVAKVRTKKANKVAAKRMKNAGRLLAENKQEAFYDEVLKALWGYISDKLNIPVSQLSKDNIEDELTKYGVAPELIKDFIGTLNECEFARYAPGNQNEAMDKVYSSAVEVISKMENSIKH